MNIINRIRTFFNSPHPIPGSVSGLRGILISITVGIFVTCALFMTNLAEPNGFRGGKLGLSLCYGFVTTIITVLFQIVIPTVAFKNVKDDKWTLLKDIGYVLVMIACIAIGNFLITLIIYPELEFTLQNFFGILISTLLIAIAPTTFFLGLSMYMNEKRFIKESAELTIVKPKTEKKTITFNSQYAEEPIIIAVDEFYFAEAESNYVRFYFRRENEMKHAMIRTTLKAVEETIADEPMILKAHRSFVINLANSSHFSGNSQGYIIHFEGTDKIARVSRSFTPKIKEILSKTS